MIPQAAAALARAVTGKRHAAFLAALSEPEAAQAKVRARIEAALPACAYGKRHGARLDDLPIVRHADLHAEIAAMQAGARDVLWPGDIDHWMTTSGSSGAKKPVPITPALKAVFADALAIWAHDALTHFYRPRTGKLFMALAPPSGQSLTHEANFLGALAPLARAFLIAPPALARTRDAAAFRALLAETLLRARALECVSLWSPTYLLALMDYIEAERGTQDWRAVWPHLRFISAWAGAAAAGPANEIQRRLPQAIFQAKGLIATEAPMTIPLKGAPAPVPLIDSVFYEFRDTAGGVHPLTDIRDGETYTLIVSAPGGFLRYEIGDLVTVTGAHARTPCLEFAGRADAVCDLAGEKLADNVAAEALAFLNGRAGLLAPRLAPARYVLLAEGASDADAAAAETQLMAGHHYARARALGQIGPVEAMRVDDLRARLIAFAAARGTSLDSIKDRALLHDLAQAEAFFAALSRTGAPPRAPSSE